MDVPHRRGPGLLAWAAVVVFVCCLMAAPSAWARSHLAFKGTRYDRVAHACPEPKARHATCFALVRIPVPSAEASEAGVSTYTAGDGLESGPTGGLTPKELASAYGFEPTASGSGQTLAIVDAYNDPNIEADLEAFDTEYKIAACTKANGCLTKVSQTGSTSSLPANDKEGWSLEISLDVEVAHSTCPNCKILLVEANSASFENLATAENEAVALGATEVSNSYGGPEPDTGATEKAAFNHSGVVIAAATGDDGYDDWTYLNEGYEPPASPNAPASFPSTVAVGGTTLDLTAAGKRESERVWNGNGALDRRYFEGFREGATGGGCSTLFTAQTWQQQTPGFAATGCGSKRLAADVAADADPHTGFDVYDSYNCGTSCEKSGIGKGWITVGGTSLSTPLVSSLYALAGGSNGVSYPSLTLYGHLGESSSLFDVTEGGNGFCDAAPEAECGHPDAFGALVEGYALDVDCEYTTACNAAPGFDGPSGVGTPNGLSLFKPLLPTAAITAPAEQKKGVVASFSAATSSDPYPGAVLTYSWNWGDGTPNGSGVAPVHTYSAIREYTVTLTVSDSYGFKSAPVAVVVKVTEETAKEIREEEEAAAAKKKAEEEAAAKKKAAEEAAKTKAAAEAAATKKHEEEAAATARQAAEVAAADKRRLEEEAAKLAVLGVKEGSPDATIASTSLQVSSSGAVTIKVSCPAGVSNCQGSLTLRSLNAVGAASSKRSVLTLATGSFAVPGGQARTVTLHLSGKARALLARLRSLKARATLLAHDPQGASHTTQTIVTLRAPKARRRG